MHADLSRRTFDAADTYRCVVLQQGRVLLDADWNEQTEITAHHDEVRTLDVVGRCGGPAPEPGASGVAALGPFAVVAADGTVPDDETSPAAWDDLRITPGRYYVDGVLAESIGPGRTGGAPDASGWPITDQPHLATIDSGDDASAGLPEPAGAADGDRYALLLDVWSHHVTPDEDPALLEPALGGPDTATRVQTVWQVRAEPLAAGGGAAPQCSDVSATAAATRTPRRMVASLTAAGTSSDPCRITTSGGYERLENQLYRVQIHHAAAGSPATFVWSRDNGTVVAGLSGLALDTDGTGTGTLTLDRLGRDEELSFASGQLVEVTSADLQLRGLPGFLATAGTPALVLDAGGSSSSLDLPVTWLGDAPASREALGEAPIVRRWDGGPTRLVPSGGSAGDAIRLESGIEVAFPGGGEARTGDYWLVPARTVRMAYGLTQLAGTIEWPPGGRGDAAQPPVGPQHHRAPLAIVRRVGPPGTGGWVLDSDCRLLFPPLTEQVTIDLVGGDGQEAMPGAPLPQPVRVAVRSGGRAVTGARLSVDAGSGTVTGPPASGADGVAAFTWTLDPAGPTTQTLTVRRLDDHDRPVDVAVVATGRLSVAREVAWTPPRDCEAFALSDTVQDALTRLVGTSDLRLLGGDGQEVSAAGRVLPQPVRVAVDSPCGPVAEIEVVALSGGLGAEAGLVAEAVEGQPRPDTLTGTGADAKARVSTGPDGVAAFWWQPEFGDDGSAVLEVLADPSTDPSIRVSAQLDQSGGRTPGVHVAGTTWHTGRPFPNDARIGAEDLVSGVEVVFDRGVLPDSLVDKPVVRVRLELPWPLGEEAGPWNVDGPVGYRDVLLAGSVETDGKTLAWAPRDQVAAWLKDSLWDVLAQHGWETPIVGWFEIYGWAVVASGEERGHLNGHADAVLAGGRTRLVMPTDDEVTGGVFRQWFRVSRDVDRVLLTVPDVSGRTLPVATRTLQAAGLVVKAVIEEPHPLVRAKLVIRTEPEADAQVDDGTGVAVVVSTGRV